MNAFSDSNVSKAIARVPLSASRDLQTLLLRARKSGLDGPVGAVERELALRGAMDFDATTADKHAAWTGQVANLTLTDAIRMAFRAAPFNEVERTLAVQIARNPGTTYGLLTQIRGKHDIALVLGHMVYEGLGFFRKFIGESKRMSDILFLRDNSAGPMTCRLTAEAEQALRNLGLV